MLTITKSKYNLVTCFVLKIVSSNESKNRNLFKNYKVYF